LALVFALALGALALGALKVSALAVRSGAFERSIGLGLTSRAVDEEHPAKNSTLSAGKNARTRLEFGKKRAVGAVIYEWLTVDDDNNKPRGS
jgi:hypothetical protein